MKSVEESVCVFVVLRGGGGSVVGVETAVGNDEVSDECICCAGGAVMVGLVAVVLVTAVTVAVRGGGSGLTAGRGTSTVTTLIVSLTIVSFTTVSFGGGGCSGGR